MPQGTIKKLATEKEIKDVINTGTSIPAKHERFGRVKVYAFKQKRHDKFYEQKRVEVIYTVEKYIRFSSD